MKNVIYLLMLCLVLIGSNLVVAQPATDNKNSQPEKLKKEQLTVAEFEKLIDLQIEAINKGQTLAEIDVLFLDVIHKAGFKDIQEMRTTWFEAIGNEAIQKVLEGKKWAELMESKIQPLQIKAQTDLKAAHTLFRNKKYDEAATALILLGKTISKDEAANCYYNAACAYSLNSDKRKACIWFAQSVKNGYRKLDHIKEDTDLDNIRKEEMYLYVVKLMEENGQLDEMDVPALEKKFFKD